MGKVVKGGFGSGNGSHEELHRLYGIEDCPVCTSEEHHPAGGGVSDERRALLDAAKWSSRIDIAREAYGDALVRCKELGLTNDTIAHAVGKSEAAVRMFVKRRKGRT